MKHSFLASSALLLFISCQTAPPEPAGDAPASAIDAAELMEHVRYLSSDELEGRLPGSAGEEKTVAYLVEQFRSLGLAPGNPDGTYLQQVPLVGITAERDMALTFQRAGESVVLEPREDFVAWTKRVVEDVSLESEIVFVGYGVEAPEYDWDDFEDVDVRGKVLLMLVNDPPGEDIFGGEAMTYYGRWTYKFEKAAEKGAAGAFIVHETAPAGYPWEVVEGSWTGEQFDLVTPDKNMDRAAVEGWIQRARAEELFRMAGLDWEEQKKAAASRSFRPRPLGVTASIAIENELRTIDSANVVARIEGSEAPDEVVLYVAHWDHLGKDPARRDDPIFNGARDNATGTAGLLEIAEAFTELPEPPRRSVVFLAVTAEEQGLLGSRYYAENPLHPPEKTVAAINMDALNIWGRTRDITIVGMGQSTLDDLAARIAAEQGRIVRPDPEPEKGFYYRSDHFELAKVGIPSFYADEGVEFEGRPEGWGIEVREKYTAQDYHKPSDEVGPSWDLSGAVQDLELFFRMGLELARSESWPEWSETSEFRSRRQR